MFYKKKAISRETYNFALREGYADGALIAKWKKVFSLKYYIDCVLPCLCIVSYVCTTYTL